jgi:hypothetical protein
VKLEFSSKEREIIWKNIEKRRKAMVLKINRRYASAASRLGVPLLKVRIKRGNYGSPERYAEVWNLETGQLVETHFGLEGLDEKTRGLNKRKRLVSDSFGGARRGRTFGG